MHLHCDACGQSATLTGEQLRDHARLWSDAHYLPVVDWVDLADQTTGAYVCTWRRRQEVA